MSSPWRWVSSAIAQVLGCLPSLKDAQVFHNTQGSQGRIGWRCGSGPPQFRAPAAPVQISLSAGLGSKESSWVHLAGEIKLFLNS